MKSIGAALISQGGDDILQSVFAKSEAPLLFSMHKPYPNRPWSWKITASPPHVNTTMFSTFRTHCTSSQLIQYPIIDQLLNRNL